MRRTPRLWLVLAGLVMMTVSAYGQEIAPPLPDRNPARASAPADQTVAAPAEIEPNFPADAETVVWSVDEIAAAETACVTQLAGVTLDYEKLPPVKEGLCGTPAPILVKAIGSNPAVVIDPPATVTCRLAVTLDAWLKDKVQPAATAALGAEVVKLRNAASYVCRNRYGGANTRISQHALANALDISEFALASGERITVLDSWPHVVPPPPPELKPASDPDAAGSGVEVTKVKAAPALPPVPPPTAKPPIDEPLAEQPSAAQLLAKRNAAFVKRMHAEACKMFGTVLGPEANEAHKDHLHFDMKPRAHANYCE